MWVEVRELFDKCGASYTRGTDDDHIVCGYVVERMLDRRGVIPHGLWQGDVRAAGGVFYFVGFAGVDKFVFVG